MYKFPIKTLPWIWEDQTINGVVSLLYSTRADAIVVVNKRKEPLGYISLRETLGYLSQDKSQENLTVNLIMAELYILDEEADFKTMEVSSKVDYYVVVDETGKYMGAVSVKDILREQLEQGRERIEELNNALNSSYDGFCISDGNGVMFYTNEAFNKTTGLTREESIGKSGVFLEENGVVTPSIVMQVLHSKGPVTTFQNYCTGKICLNSANPIFNYKGEIVRVITNVRDMTELIRLKEQLNATKELVSGYENELTQMRFEQYKQNEIVAKSDQMNRVLELAFRVGQADSTVLITGESGVGKEIVANVIYLFNPQRNKGPFIKINCGALPENLLESELFGYEKGAFTGAKNEGKPGKFELANNGTIFLDEIGDMPMPLQVKLLRVLQDKEVTRLGGVKPVPLNVRIIAATNQNLQKLISQGKFREDLYYRLNVVPIHIPALRERKSDIQPLVLFFLHKYNNKYNHRRILSSKAMHILESYNWPGNIRELENVVENLVVLTNHEKIEPVDLPECFHEKNLANYYKEDVKLDEILAEVEKDILIKAFNKYKLAKDVAHALGLSPASVCRKAQKYNI